MFMGHYKQTVKPQLGTCSHSHSCALVRGVRGLLAVFWYAEELAACLWLLGNIQLQFVLKMQSYVTVLPITLHFPKMSCGNLSVLFCVADVRLTGSSSLPVRGRWLTRPGTAESHPASPWEPMGNLGHPGPTLIFLDGSSRPWPISWGFGPCGCGPPTLVWQPGPVGVKRYLETLYFLNWG